MAPEAVLCCGQTLEPARPAAQTLRCPCLAMRALSASVSTSVKWGTQFLSHGIPVGTSGNGQTAPLTQPASTVPAVGCRWQELCWTGSLAQDPGPGIIQDWAEHHSAAVSVDGAKARVVRPSSEVQPFPWVHLYLQWHGHLGNTARERRPQEEQGGTPAKEPSVCVG